MNRKTSQAVSRVLLSLLIGTPLAFTPAHAEDRGNSGRYNPYGGGAHMHMDGRHSNDHSYHDHGYEFRGRPHNSYEIRHGGNTYWYDRNHWYRQRGGLSIVIGAPIGAFVPLLPSYYSTIWWAGVPYYYANDTYYTWNGQQDEYQVVDPPPGIDSGATTDAPPSDQIFVYPRNGQSADQQARDRYECHRSAADQTGYDPTVSGGGVSAAAASGKRSDYLRGQASCLDARGYSVR